MRHVVSLLVCLGLASLLAGSAILRPAIDFGPRHVALKLVRVTPRGLTANPPLRFVAGWTLSSSDPDFGGISALARSGRGFIALSDAGNLIRFSIDRRNRSHGTIESVPLRCGLGAGRITRDSESLALDPSGDLWIGFEYDNRICRIGVQDRIGLARPRQMGGWPITRGPETMARLGDGRFIIIGESRIVSGERRVAPGLIFGGDPASPGTPVTRFSYRLHGDYRATDAATLPDGSLLVLERDHTGFYSFPGRLAIVAAGSVAKDRLVESRKLIWLNNPELDQNFEAVAVSRARGHTFVWLMSDDNFIPVQQTMLLLFEYKP